MMSYLYVLCVGVWCCCIEVVPVLVVKRSPCQNHANLRGPFRLVPVFAIFLLHYVSPGRKSNQAIRELPPNLISVQVCSQLELTVLRILIYKIIKIIEKWFPTPNEKSIKNLFMRKFHFQFSMDINCT